MVARPVAEETVPYKHFHLGELPRRNQMYVRGKPGLVAARCGEMPGDARDAGSFGEMRGDAGRLYAVVGDERTASAEVIQCVGRTATAT